MSIFYSIILASWFTFIVVWGVSAIGVKKDIGDKKNFRISILLRLLIAVAAIVWLVWERSFGTSSNRLTYRPLFDYYFIAHPNPIVGTTSPVVGIIAVILCVGGVAFAIWARLHLGREWSAYPTIKEGHRLITSGPYAYVRHPIYTGILLAILGSTLSAGLLWLIIFCVALLVFLRRVRIEEQLMTKLFPDEYPEYKKHTKALIPFIW